MDYKAPRRYRLRRRSDINAVFDEGKSARDRIATMIARRNELPHCRTGVGISRRHGNAVRRNRVKRLCREALRLTRPDLPTGWDFMLLPRAGAKFTLAGLQESVMALAGRLARTQPGKRPQGRVGQ